MPRPRTPKGIAKRIELQYFKRLHPFRRWKLILTIAAPAIAAVWLIALAARGDQRIYASGPVSTSHAMFGLKCGHCHTPASMAAILAGPAGKSYWLRVSDKACLKCHDGPTHHESQTITPECATCHVEHKGHVVLAFMSDQHCTRCHADLQTKGPPTPFERRIQAFGADHPEFAVLVKDKDQTRRIRLDDKARLKDTAQVKLNHKKHKLTCTYCHKPDNWRAYLEPIVYTKHCDRACHPLDFDTRLAETVAPHDRPEIVHAFLREIFTETFEQCQTLKTKEGRAENRAAEGLKKRCQELGLIKGEEEGKRPRGRAARREEAQKAPSPEQWVRAQMQSAQAVLFKQKCEYCHMLTYRPEKLPEVSPTAIPIRWLPHSRFDHGAHRMLACTECHKAKQSKETTDVLLPSIATCRDCHRDSGGARSGCVECHLYHDKAKDRDLNGPFTVRELMRAAPPAAVTAPTRPGG